MTKFEINQVLEAIATFPLEDQEFIVDTVNHRIREAKREAILLRAKQAEANYELGNVQIGTVADLLGEIITLE
jgi:hypothetical protein